MNDFRYIIDENGDKTAVIIDLIQHKDVWEEFSQYFLKKNNFAKQPITSFSNMIEKSQVDEISKAIEENCEKIDNEW